MPEPKIDLHSHWFSPTVTRLLSERRQGVRIERAQAGSVALVRGVDDALPARFDLGPQWFDLDLRLEHLASVGIVHQLISWPTTLGVDPLSAPGEALELWQAYNKDLGQLVREHPAQFSAVAALSTSDIGWSVDELARAHEQRGLIGAVLDAWIGDHGGDWMRWEPHNCAVSVLDWDGDHWHGVIVNDISHLPEEAIIRERPDYHQEPEDADYAD